MTSLHFVKKARKAIKGTDIKKGDSYYWWKFAYGTKQASKTAPRRSQLTRSEFYSTMYDHEDNLAALDRTDPETLAADLRSMAEEIESFGQEQSEKRDNMPEGLQDSETGELLQTRADECEAIAQSLNEAADALDNLDREEEDFDLEREVDAILEGIDFSYS